MHFHLYQNASDGLKKNGRYGSVNPSPTPYSSIPQTEFSLFLERRGDAV